MKIFFWVDFSSSKDKNFWYLYSIKIFRFVNLTIEFTEQKFNCHHSVECLKKHEFVLRFYEILEKLYALKVVKIFDFVFEWIGLFFFFSEPILQFCFMHVYLVSKVTPSFLENKESPNLCMQRMLRVLAAWSRYRYHEFNFINFCIFFSVA